MEFIGIGRTDPKYGEIVTEWPSFRDSSDF